MTNNQAPAPTCDVYKALLVGAIMGLAPLLIASIAGIVARLLLD